MSTGKILTITQVYRVSREAKAHDWFDTWG